MSFLSLISQAILSELNARWFFYHLAFQPQALFTRKIPRFRQKFSLRIAVAANRGSSRSSRANPADQPENKRTKLVARAFLQWHLLYREWMTHWEIETEVQAYVTRVEACFIAQRITKWHQRRRAVSFGLAGVFFIILRESWQHGT